MHPSKVRERLARGETAFGTSLQFTDPAVFEMTASLGFDAIWLDMEHHSVTDAQAAELVRAARAGGPTDVVIRPGKGEFMRMARLFEAGAHGVMYPRCESAAEAAEVVRWAKFAPIGERGFDGAGADGEYMSHPMVDYLRRANANTFVIVQVEDERSIARCEELIAVEGVDMLMLGPADLTVLSGRPGEFDHSSIRDAFRRIAAAAKAAGKSWASTSMSLDHAKQLVQMGAELVFHGADIVFVRRGLIAVRDALRGPAGAAAAPALEGVSCAGGAINAAAKPL
jgi:4-hydroxy-2-oxoheptanedioate aldolase